MKRNVFSFPSKCNYDKRNIIHSIKVGIALVLVSLLYLLDPLFKQVGENAMWAIMTVVVVFEFFAGKSTLKYLVLDYYYYYYFLFWDMLKWHLLMLMNRCYIE